MIDPALPFIDLHRHLEGCIRLSTMLDLAQQHGLELPGKSLSELRPHVVIDSPQGDLVAFLNKLNWMILTLADLDACRRIAYESIEDAAAEGLDYLELRFSPLFMARPHALDATGVVAAVIDGVKAAEQDFQLKTNLIGIMSRTYGPESCHQELDALLAHRNDLRGLDLAGDEARWPGHLFYEHFKKGRDAGWEITVHAGEAGGSENIRYAVEELGATRIGHGIAAAEDKSVLDLLIRNQIGLEINLTSNVQTNTVSSLSAHPIRHFLEWGLAVSINTDDPTISGIDLPSEFLTAAREAGLTPEHTKQMQKHAVDGAFVSNTERAEIIRTQATRQKQRVATPRNG